MNTFRVLSITALSLGLFACGQSDSPTVTTTAQPAAPAQPVAAKSIQVGLVMKTLTNPFFIEMERGARRAEKELRVSLQVKTAAQETSVEQQIQLIEDLITAKVDAIVLAPADSQSLVPTVKKALDAGIKIVNIDNRLDPEVLKKLGIASVPFISVDNDAGAYKAGKHLGSQASGNANAAIIEGIRSADNARQRMEGAKRGLLENTKIKVVASETANWKIDDAYTVTKAIFAKHPDVSLVFAANDMMALGAIKYLAEAGKTSVKVTGYDAMAEALAAVKSGKLLATVDQQAAEQGYQGVALALRLLKGEAVPETTLIETRLITAAEVN